MTLVWIKHINQISEQFCAFLIIAFKKNPKFNSKCLKKCLIKMQVKFKHDGQKEKYEKTRKTLNYILSMFFVIIFMKMYIIRSSWM